MAITLPQLQQIYNRTPVTVLSTYIDGLNKMFDDYEINTPRRMSVFLGQVGEESACLQVVTENLHYSADRLLQVFPRYFNDNNVDDYAGNPEKIANRVYSNRMGNGDEASGDGYLYRGRGAIQLTGKSNYAAFAKDFQLTLEQTVAYLVTPEGIIYSAGWFWDNHDISDNADAWDIIGATKKINGGTNGLGNRTAIANRALSILN